MDLKMCQAKKKKMTIINNETTEGIELSNKEWIRILGEKKGQILEIIRSGHHQADRDERKKVRKKHFRRIGKLLETKWWSRNFIGGINNLNQWNSCHKEFRLL